MSEKTIQQEFSKVFMEENRGCYDLEELHGCSFMKQEPVTLSSILDSEIPLKDKYWFVCRKLLSKEQNQQIAIAVAEIVLPIYEKRYPGDTRVRECIEAAKQYIAGHISLEKLIEKRRAADAAYAAYAAYAADAAADAAYAAYAAYAADAAADAAYAAYAADAAADAAYAAYAAADIKQQLLDYLKSFCLTPQTV